MIDNYSVTRESLKIHESLIQSADGRAIIAPPCCIIVKHAVGGAVIYIECCNIERFDVEKTISSGTVGSCIVEYDASIRMSLKCHGDVVLGRSDFNQRAQFFPVATLVNVERTLIPHRDRLRAADRATRGNVCPGCDARDGREATRRRAG